MEEGEDVKAGRDLQEAALGSGEIYKTAQNLGCILLLFKMKANSENNASLNVFECEWTCMHAQEFANALLTENTTAQISEGLFLLAEF